MKFFSLLLLFIFQSSFSISLIKSDNKTSTERFLRGVYGCNPEVVDNLASDDIILSYPVFQKLFNKNVIRGRAEVENFARGFCSRWKNIEITIHESIEEENNVVLLWSFKGTYAGPPVENGPVVDSVHEWGGISLFKFDDQGKITAEIGEESTPGPFHRVNPM